MFLNMHVNETESLWLEFISEEKLRTFKQLVLTLKPEDNLRGLNKLNNTHYIINIKNFGDKITITYLRKDIILEPIFEEEEEAKLVEEIVAVELEFFQEQAPLVEEEPIVVVDEVKVIEEDEVKVIEEETELIDDAKVIEEESLEEPVKKKRTYNKKKKV
jgi:virulence-associated protein VagC